MNFLTELYQDHKDDESGVYDRAVDMINSAVEEHNFKDEFEKIADVEGLIDFLKGRFHDFSDELEQNVRDIIADEKGEDEPDLENGEKDLDSEESDLVGYDEYDGLDDEYDEQDDENDLAQYKDERVPGEEEEINDLLTPAGKRRLQQTDWDEEIRSFQKRARSDRSDGGRARLQSRRRKTSSSSPFSVGFEQEETNQERLDRRIGRPRRESNKERFNRRMIDLGARRPRETRKERLARRLSFEGFKKFHNSFDE